MLFVKLWRVVLVSLILTTLSCSYVPSAFVAIKGSHYQEKRNQAYNGTIEVVALEEPHPLKGMAGDGVGGFGAHLLVVTVRRPDGTEMLTFVKKREQIRKGQTFEIAAGEFCVSAKVRDVIKDADYLP
jgi:hypothetical protein